MGLKENDAIVIRCGERVVEGVVLLASSNGESLMIGFEALLNGHAGMMPLSRQPDGSYRSIIDGTVVRVEPKRLRPSR